jgi:hypothetical protein
MFLPDSDSELMALKGSKNSVYYFGVLLYLTKYSRPDISNVVRVYQSALIAQHWFLPYAVTGCEGCA